MRGMDKRGMEASALGKILIAMAILLALILFLMTMQGKWTVLLKRIFGGLFG
jgi:hypothetical protein